MRATICILKERSEGAGRRGEPTPSQAGRPEQKQTPQQRGEGIRGVPPPQGEQSQPQQERGEGNKEQQGPETFDGHEPDAWLRDSAIFKSRTLEGMKAVREEIERVRESVKLIDQIYQDQADKQYGVPGAIAGKFPVSRITEKFLLMVCTCFHQQT